jgi:hypothetical protein
VAAIVAVTVGKYDEGELQREAPPSLNDRIRSGVHLAKALQAIQNSVLPAKHGLFATDASR